MYRGESQIFVVENMKKKKFQSSLFSPLERWTGNNFLFRVAVYDPRLGSSVKFVISNYL